VPADTAPLLQPYNSTKQTSGSIFIHVYKP
jgi:hypothetical protein